MHKFCVTELFVAGLIQGELGLVHYLIVGAAAAAGLVLVACSAVLLWHFCKLDLRRSGRRPRFASAPSDPPPSHGSVVSPEGDVDRNPDYDPGIMLLPSEEGGSLRRADIAC